MVLLINDSPGNGYRTRILVVGAKVTDLIHRNQPYGPTLGDRDPAQELPWRVDAGELIKKCAEVGWLRQQALTQTGHGGCYPRHRQRLHHIVDSALFERGHGVLIVSRNEHDVSVATCDSSNLETRSPPDPVD